MTRLLSVDGTAWVVLSALLCLGAIVVTVISAGSAVGLDWQPALGLREPWRLWTCAWVHGSSAHLFVNLAGGAVVAFVGWRARLPNASAMAWFVAWPGTQVLMAAVGSERLAAVMPHYFGLSGVLHAGVAVLGLSLAWPVAPARASAAAQADEPSSATALSGRTAVPATTPDSPSTPFGEERPPRERWIGVAIVVGTLAKVVSEAPWDLVPRTSEALGIAVAPIAHACGLAAGVLAWGAMRLLARLQT